MWIKVRKLKHKYIDKTSFINYNETEFYMRAFIKLYALRKIQIKFFEILNIIKILKIY